MAASTSWSTAPRRCLSTRRDEIFSTDVDGTRIVLESALEHGIARVVHISSTAVYGIPDHHPIYEDDRLQGVGPYGEAKIGAEQHVPGDPRQGPVRADPSRPSRFVGPERLGVFELLYDWASDGRNFPVLGGGDNRYQLLDVEDLCQAIYLCATLDRDRVNDTFNVGRARSSAPCARTSRRCSTTPATASGSSACRRRRSIWALKVLEALQLSPLYKWVYETAGKDSFVSIERIEQRLGFVPRYSNREALIRNFDWYLAHRDQFRGTSGHLAPRAVEAGRAAAGEAGLLRARAMPAGALPGAAAPRAAGERPGAAGRRPRRHAGRAPICCSNRCSCWPSGTRSACCWCRSGWRKGKACLKRHLAREAMPDVAALPYRRDAARAGSRRKAPRPAAGPRDRGRPALAEAVAHHVGLFDAVLASDGTVNLPGSDKRRPTGRGVRRAGLRLRRQRPQRPAGLARRPQGDACVQAEPGLAARAGRGRRGRGDRRRRPRRRLASYLAALRPHHWLKNALVFLPLLAAHRIYELDLLWQGLLVFVAFSLCASSAYLLNDLLDLPSDRHHPRKRDRAAGIGTAAAAPRPRAGTAPAVRRRSRSGAPAALAFSACSRSTTR